LKRSLAHSIVALILASNYFAFQCELFDDEYEENHPKPAETCSVSAPGLNWESFDKDHAQPPFVFDAHLQFEVVGVLPSPIVTPIPSVPSFFPVRDKSPPAASLPSGI
jgi:hypothetical protein